MRENSRTGSSGAGREGFELSLDRRQAIALVAGAVAVVGIAFAIGMSAGGRVAARAQPGPAASDLAKLDEPLPVAPSEEPPPALAAHDALVSPRPMDKTLPVPEVKSAPREPAAPAPASPPLAGPLAIAGAASAGTVTPPSVAPPPTPPDPPAVADATRTGARPHAAARPARAAAVKREHAKAKASRAGARPGTPRYAIQIGAAAKRADAERLARRAGGHGTRIVEARVPGKGHVYRVQVGAYDSREAASRHLAALSRSGLSGFVVAAR